jgi:hypothetical protein
MAPNDLYRTNPHAQEWLAKTTACGERTAAIRMELGKFYFASYGNMNSDDSYPLLMPYDAEKDTAVAISLHLVPMGYYGKVMAMIAEWKASLDKKESDPGKLAKVLGKALGNYTRRYPPRLFKAVWRISDIGKAYALWLNFSGQAKAS